MKLGRFFPLTVLAALVALAGCIKNDIPYPKMPQLITAIAVEGQYAPAQIDNETHTVTLFLDEATNPYKVTFTEFEYTEDATSSLNLLEGTYDLSQPLEVTLSHYQDYVWTIKASQSITRDVTIEGQIGNSVIDTVAHRVIVSVPETADLSRLTVTSLKLGPEGITTYLPALSIPGVYSFVSPMQIGVVYWDKIEVWKIYVEKTELLVSTSQVDAWSEVIWAYGNGPSSGKNGFQYREASSQEWIDVPGEWLSVNGGSFSACIPHLKPLTEYVVRAISDDNLGNEVKVMTQPTTVLIDGSFDQWWLNGKIWCPWDENGTQYWDTGNTGAATLGTSNVQPSDDTPTGTGKSARLETRFVGIGMLGKLAAGSIYTGKFAKVDGTNGILDFGRPFSLRPTKLKGYMKFHTEPMNYASSEYKDLIGVPDSCHIYIAVTDWSAPYQIRTNPNNRQLFDKNASYIIGYGELITGTDVDDWTEFEILLNYKSTSLVPSYIQITAAASKYGDFFTGGTGTILYVDDFSLHYDY